MAEEQQRATHQQMDQIARALHVISQPALRRAFLSHPLDTLKEHGAGELPERLVNVLADMTYEELSVVARLYLEECPPDAIPIGMRLDGGTGCIV